MARVVCFVLVLLATPARAQEVQVDLDVIIEDVFKRVNSPMVEKIAVSTVRRARRAIAIGPTVGGWGAYLPKPEIKEAAVTFGVGVEVFKIPVLPSMKNIKAVIEERVKAKLKQQIIDRFKGVPPQPVELDRMAAEVFEEVKAEFLGERDVRSKTFERPRFSFGLEANRLFEAEAWLGRLRVGIGISRVTLAVSTAVGRANEDTAVLVGPELVLHALLAKGARSPVVDVFVRGDFELTDRGDRNTDHISVGARFLLDVL